MGSSSKKRKEKKKDFQKPKLKVGKTRPKAANTTDTRFKAKAITLKQQSLFINAPSVEAQCSHHLSLLTHRSEGQRRDSLAYLTTIFSTSDPSLPLPQPASLIIPTVQRLLLDGSNDVRSQTLKLLKTISRSDIGSHIDQLMLYTRAAMTHLSTNIRTFALNVLDWLLDTVGVDVVSCSGGWIKTLKCFLSLLGWQNDTSSKWTSSALSNKKSSDAKIQAKQINTLKTFLEVGLLTVDTTATVSNTTRSFPIWQGEYHILSERSDSFSHLNLFGATRDEETEMYGDVQDRCRLFHDKVEAAVVAGVESAVRSGGDLGRAAANLRKVVQLGMANYRMEELG